MPFLPSPLWIGKTFINFPTRRFCGFTVYLDAAVKNLAKDRICIVVTHDPGTMKVCDYVYAIDEGVIAESGAPSEISVAEEIFA